MITITMILLHRNSTMMLLRSLAAVLAIAAAPAMAGSVPFTPPLFPDGGNQLDCYLLNVSGGEREVRIEVFTKDGVVLAGQTLTLAAGTERVVTVPAYSQPRYCKFSVDGLRSDVRGSILVREPGRGSISALAAQ